MKKQEIKFYFQKYKKGTYWSNSSKTTFESDNIGNQVWLADGVPCKGECLTLEEILPKLNKTTKKSERDLIMRFEVNEFPIADKTDFSKWDGIIFVDIDAQHSKSLRSLPIEAQKNYMFDIQNQLEMDCIDTFYYIEHSSSGVGMHIMFYYECPRTKDYFLKAAEYTKDLLFNMKYRDFGKVIQEIDERPGKELNKKTFDEVYKKPFQKCYLTGIDGSINEYCTGNINIAELDKYEIKYTATTIDDLPADGYEYKVKKIDVASHMTTRDWSERRSDIYAVKLLEPNQDKAYKLIEHIAQFYIHERNDGRLVNEMKNMYNSLDVKYADLDRLKRFGIYINKDVKHIHLSDNQYLGDILDKLLEESPIGVSLWQAPTGGGKTTAWISLNKKILESGDTTHKPIAIVEPLISIVKSKYDDDVIDVTGSKQFPAQLNGYGMYVTNFNKFVRKDKDTGEYVPRDGIVEYMSQFGLVVIDESHTLAKDRFRANVLIPFTRVIAEISKSVKVIIQTATPMAENELIDIKRKFIITKKPDKDINVSFKRLESNKIIPYYLNSLVQDNVNEGRNTYIYWSNAPVDKLEDFRASYPYPENVGIFHKKDIDGDDSKHNVSTYHVLDSKNYKGTDNIVPYKYNVFLSSVYFGVGNDLDDPEDAAVIIVGLKTWQEIIQVIGRFRNSKNIVVYIILTKSDCEFLDSTIEHPRTLQQRIKYWKEQYANIWYDKENKDKSITIYGQSYMLFSKADVWPYAIIMASEQHNQTMKAIVDNLTSEYYNIKVDDDYTQYLVIDNDKDTKKRHTKFANQLKKVRDKTIRAIMEGKINDKVKAQIHKDTKLAKFKPLWDNIKQYGIHKLLDADFIAARSNWKMLSLFINIYKKLLNRKVEYEELYAFVWYRMQANTNDIVKVWDREITKAECNAIFAYIRFVCLKNKDKNNYKVKGLYYKQFKNKCKLFATIPNELIDMLWKTKSMYESVYQCNIAIRQFFEDDYDMLLPSATNLDNTKISSLDDVVAQTTHNIQYYIDNNKEVSYVLARIFNLDNVCVKAGGKAGVKKCVILKAMPTKKLSKYGLNVGDEFESGDALADKTGVKKCTITTWRKKKWIE